MGPEADKINICHVTRETWIWRVGLEGVVGESQEKWSQNPDLGKLAMLRPVVSE